ncbi:MAG: TolC family protein [Rikenellaceae bacterium]
MKNIIYLSILAVAIACSPVKNLETVKVELPEDFKFELDDKTSHELSLDTAFWRNFGDTVLNNLVLEALANNYDLKTAYSNVLISRRNLGVTRGELLPNFNLELSAEGEYTPATKIEQTYVVTPTMNWEFNLAGKQSNSIKVARYESYSDYEEYKDVMLSVVCELVTSYISILEYKRALELAEQTYASRHSSVSLIDSLFRYGMSSGLDLAQAKALEASAAVAIPKYRQALEQSILNINIVLGTTGVGYERFKNCELQNMRLPIIKAGLPSDILKNRSDLRAAMYDLESARSGVKVAHAARFPSISLTVDGGLSSSHLKSLVNGNPSVWGATVSLLQPILYFGINKNNERIAVEKYNKALYAYELDVITAFKEVEVALLGIELYKRQLHETLNLVESNKAIEHMTSRLYLEGFDDYLNQLDAQRELFATELSYIQLYAAQVNSYLSLFKALNFSPFN